MTKLLQKNSTKNEVDSTKQEGKTIKHIQHAQDLMYTNEEKKIYIQR